MNEEEKKAIKDIKRTVELYELKPIDRISVEFDEFDYKIFKTILNLIEKQQSRIDELEKALVEEAIKSKVLELYNQRINKLKDKLKKDIKNNKSGINLMDLRCIGKWQEAKEILKILEE